MELTEIRLTGPNGQCGGRARPYAGSPGSVWQSAPAAMARRGGIAHVDIHVGMTKSDVDAKRPLGHGERSIT